MADAALVRTIYDPPRARHPWALRELFPARATTYYSVGRWALVEALRACDAGARDCVLVPELICREVIASIDVVGARAVFYPVSRSLEPASLPVDAAPVRAVVAVNYFGFPQDLGPFRRYSARTGAVVIEDNAHGMLSRDEDGVFLGTRGDAGIFSFRKTFAVPDGGALVLTGRGALRQSIDGLPPRGGLAPRYRAKQAFRRVAGQVTPDRALKTICGLRRVRTMLGRGVTAFGVPESDTAIRVRPNPRPWIFKPLRLADPGVEGERRRALYGLVGRIVEATGVTPVFPSLPPHVVPYGYPVFVSNDQVSSLAAHLARHGLPLSHWPDLPPTVAATAAGHYRDLFVVPFLW